jgi:hypothetical protein
MQLDYVTPGARRRAPLSRDGLAPRHDGQHASQHRAARRACKPALTALQEYTRSTALGDYDADVLLRLLDDRRAPLQTHLTAEISTFLALERDCDSAALLHMCRTVEKAASVRPNFL